jgi:nuclear receptor subfamily 1 group D protein 3
MSCVFGVGFQELSQDDQLILIKGGFFEIWLTRMVRMLNSQDNSLTFGDGSCIPRTELEVIYLVSFSLNLHLCIDLL